MFGLTVANVSSALAQACVRRRHCGGVGPEEVGGQLVGCQRAQQVPAESFPKPVGRRGMRFAHPALARHLPGRRRQDLCRRLPIQQTPGTKVVGAPYRLPHAGRGQIETQPRHPLHECTHTAHLLLVKKAVRRTLPPVSSIAVACSASYLR
ncbi:MAG: hypothetical protein ACOX2S_08690 [bacterium]